MKKWSVVIILAFAQFVMVLDSTVMNVSISTIVQDLKTTVGSLQNAITFYTLTMAALMLIGAKLSARWGLLRAFVIGSIVYSIGSLMTGLAPNVQILLLGWSVIEGLGAVLVIPSIVALIATNYSGKDRVTAYAIIGGISGAAAAAGPLIGGYVTTYLSWRYVFITETIIMVFVLLLSRSFKSGKKDLTQSIDIPSALLSASGMMLIVYGLLQSKVWGWITPLVKPEFGGREIAPLGISLVAYLILAGVILLKIFWDRQDKLEKINKQPLLTTSMLSIKQLRSGLAVLSAQYIITAAIFFIIPIYLQMVLGMGALETGKRILPLSVALIVFSMVGATLSQKFSPRRIVYMGQVLLICGSISLLSSINLDLGGVAFSMAMFAVGAGLGLLASQISNVNMSSVEQKKSSEIGGLQGSLQNLGSSLGTALIGSVLIASLTSGFINNIHNSDLPAEVKSTIAKNVSTGVEIVPIDSIKEIAMKKGVPAREAEIIVQKYGDAQITGLRKAAFFLIVLSVFALFLTQGIPNEISIKPKKESSEN